MFGGLIRESGTLSAGVHDAQLCRSRHTSKVAGATGLKRFCVSTEQSSEKETSFGERCMQGLSGKTSLPFTCRGVSKEVVLADTPLVKALPWGWHGVQLVVCQTFPGPSLNGALPHVAWRWHAHSHGSRVQTSHAHTAFKLTSPEHPPIQKRDHGYFMSFDF